MITIANLNKKFGNNVVLHDIDFQFEAGKVYGIVGANGAGKTTLFRCIAGLETYEGNITATRDPIKNHLGFLMTDLYFFPRMTGREYVRLLCNARAILTVDIDRNNIFELPLDQYAATYSTGMKKKLALMAVLLQQNDYFILDEPFNGVDIQSNMMIELFIHRLKELNKVVLLSSHIFSTLSSTCDELLVLKEGKIADHVTKEHFAALEESMKTSVIDAEQMNEFDLR